MKLKYYLRGLGIGIIATVLVLMVASIGKKDGMTDEEIIARAEELGMVMKDRSGGILDKLQENEEGKLQENGEPSGNGEQPDNGSQSQEGEGVPDGGQPQGNDPAGDGSQPQDNGPTDDGSQPQGNVGGVEPSANGEVPAQEGGMGQDIVTVQVGRGEYSDKISEKLRQAGLIDNAEAFNKYLMESGVDNMISVGDYTIPRGASYQDIARILSEEPSP